MSGSLPAATPLVFQPRRRPTGLRRVWQVVGDLYPVVFCAAVLLSGPSGVWGAVLKVCLGLAAAFATYAAISRWRSGGRTYDPREEVVLPAELVAEVRALRLQDRRREAWKRVSQETGLGLTDTVDALELIDTTIPPGTPRVKARWGGLGASR